VSPEHVGWCKASAWALGEVLAGLPRPMSRAAMVLDLDFMVDRRKMTGEPVPGVRLLSRRWGVGVKAARLAVEAWRRDSLVGRAEVEGHGEGHAQGHAQGHGEGHALSATMPMGSTSPEQEGHAQGHGEGHAQGHIEGTPVAQEPLFMGIVAAPQTSDIQTADKTKKTRAKAKPGTVSDEEVSAILAEMHAVLLPYYPSSKPPTISAQRNRIAFALNTLAEMSRETGRPARHLLIAGFRFMADENKGYWQRAFPVPSKWYEVGCQAEKVKSHAEAALQLEAATYIPTADEALDAVIEVGCSGAEQRYPAGARCIRQTFDYAMGGDLNRMRNHPDPAKVRARWSAGYAKYLTPKPALALVAR
jgi:hypothetical protein